MQLEHRDSLQGLERTQHTCTAFLTALPPIQATLWPIAMAIVLSPAESLRDVKENLQASRTLMLG